MSKLSVSRWLSGRLVLALVGATWVLSSPGYAAQVASAWAGGAISSNWNVLLNWSPAGVPNNGVDRYNVSIDSGLGGGAVVALNLNSTIDTLFIGGNDQLTMNNNQSLSLVGPTAGALLHNNGTLLLNSIGNTTTLTIAPGSITGTGEIVLGNRTANRLLTSGAGVLTQEAGHTIRGGGTLLANTGGFINQGAVIADQSVALSIDPDANGFINQGVLQATGSGGLSLLASTYTNTGRMIEVGTGSKLTLNSGVEIIGGTLKTTGTGVINAVASTPILDGVVLEGVLKISNNTQTTIRSSIENQGTINLLSIGNTTTLNFEGAQTINGVGSIVFSNYSSNRIITDNTVLTNGLNHTIRGAGNLLGNTGGMVNKGTIIADQSVALTIDPNALGFVNEGTLEAAGTGGIIFNSGVYTNTGHTISVLDGSKLNIGAGVDILGGTLQTAGSGAVNVTASTPLFDGVTLNGDLNVANNTKLELQNGFTNNGTVNLNSIGNTTDLDFTGAQTLGGTGSVVFSNYTNNRITIDNQVLTLGANQTLRGSGQLLANTGGMVSKGSIIQEGSAKLSIDPNGLGFDNQGLLRATGSGGIRFEAGQFTNTGNTIEIEDGSELEIVNQTVITGGTLKATGPNATGLVQVISSTPTLDAVTLEADLILGNNLTLNIRNDLVNNATLRMNSIGNATDLKFEARALSGVGGLADGTLGAVLSGSGSVAISNYTGNRIYSTGGVFVLESGQTLHGSGQLMANLGGMLNKGSIIQEGSATLTLDPNGLGFDNQGLLRATGSGGIRFEAGQFTNTGNTIEIEDGSELEIVNQTVITGGTLKATGPNATGLVRVISSTPTLDAVTLEADLLLNNNLRLDIRNDLANNATLRMNSIGNATDLVFEAKTLTGVDPLVDGTSGAVLSGNGTVLMSNYTGNRIYSSGGTVVLAQTQMVRGSGQLMANLGGFLNKGTIIQEGSASLTLDPNSQGFFNRGVFKATGSGGLIFQGGVFDNTGHTIEISDGSKLSITNQTRIRGGTIQGTGSAEVILAASTPILEGVTLESDLRINNNLTLQIESGLTNHSTLKLNSIGNATNLVFVGDQSLGGTGEVVLSNYSSNRIYGSGATITHGVGHTLRGSGQLLINLGGMVNKGRLIADQSSPLSIDPSASHAFVNEGVVEAQGAGKVIFLAGFATNAAAGVFRGDNIIDVSAATFQNDGIIQPGIDGIGSLEIDGSIPFSSTAELEIQIGGTVQGTEFDFLSVTGGGAVSLAGDLKLRLLGFTPDVSDTFTILSTDGSVTGIFDNDTSGIIAFANGGFFVTYNPQSVVLHSFDPSLAIIPEPRALALFAGLLALLATGRRRRVG